VSARRLSLEIVTPDGVAVSEDAVELVVLRRRERRFERGSEIAVFPLHAPLLVRVPVAPARYRTEGRTVHLALGGGFAEVKRDRVLVVTPRCERFPAGEPDPIRAARALCRRWEREMRDLGVEMVGAP
jgi:F0F1-type ATP synthase epsilon subunit